jgi:hypothetical protein
MKAGEIFELVIFQGVCNAFSSFLLTFDKVKSDRQATQPPLFDRLGRCPLWAATGGAFPGKSPSQPERCVMIEHRAGRCVARKGLAGMPPVVVPQESPVDQGTMTMCPLVLSEP